MGAIAVLAVWFLLLAVAVPSSNAMGFNCTSARTCQSMIGYTPPYKSNMSEIKRLFNLTSTRSLITANSLPLSTGISYQFQAGSTVRVPFPCRCINKTGISDRTPVYTVKAGDFLYHIAEFFDGFVTYNDIAIVNNILNASLIYGGQRLWIPLPCSCDDVDGSHVTHYGLSVASGSTLQRIAEEFGTTQETLLRVNGMSDPMSLRDGQILHVPLQGTFLSDYDPQNKYWQDCNYQAVLPSKE